MRVLLLLISARALQLRIRSPEHDQCVPHTTAVIVEVLAEAGDEAIAAELGAARICVEGQDDAGAVTRSCAVPGGGEVHVDLPRGATVALGATMQLSNETRASTEQPTRVATTIDDTHLACADGRDPFPLLEATRRALKLRAAARGSGVLEVGWPRPGTLIRSPTVAVAVSVAFANGSLARPAGAACALIRSLEDGREVESCVTVDTNTEHLEFRVPYQGRIGLSLTIADRVAQPLDLVVDPAPRAPPLRDSVDNEAPPGWVLKPHAMMPPLVLVLCHYEEDLTWLQFQPFPAVVYEKHPNNVLRAGLHGVPRNTANEASAFLKFIVDYYDALPEVMVFLHGHRYAYHQEDVLSLLDGLEASTLPGYCNLNLAVWGLKEDPLRRPLYEEHRGWLEKWLGALPPLLLDRCCAQFIVRRECVRLRPRAFYEEALHHAYYDAEPGDVEANRRLGLLFEWLWHYLFGEPAVSAELGDLVDGIETTHLVYLAGDRRRPECLPDA